MDARGYFASPWPAEDGGPRRLQAAAPASRLDLQPGETLACVTRNTLLSTMTVLGAPGEVFLLTHSALRANFGLPTSAQVERIDPLSLQTLEASPRLAGGPMWPGGMALHANGDLYVVYGRHVHRLDRRCALKVSRRLPVNEPYNSFVILDNGFLVAKNLSEKTSAQLCVIDPATLEIVQQLDCGEPSIARLSADGNSVYVVGVHNILRLHWQDAAGGLAVDNDWRATYRGSAGQTFGWDVVIDGRDAWFMDNGRHRYRINMLGAGVSKTPNRLLRVALDDAADVEAVEVSGLRGGSITNPPLVDTQRAIVIGYDSANRVLQAWRRDEATRALAPLWRKAPFGCASHMILYPDSGELVINDYRSFGEEVVVLDIATGAERGRVRPGGIMQGVVFPSPGWGRDFYWSSMGRLARCFVQAAA